MASEVISLAERLKQHREQRGISQSQAARELDVARTAYRLWEMEAAKPAPDRWRLIASWLGVSITTMLLAEDLVTEEEAVMGDVISFDFGGTKDETGKAYEPADGGFFAQARTLVARGTERGELTSEQADALEFLIARIEQESKQMATEVWAAAQVRKSLSANKLAPRSAREAVSLAAEDLPDEVLQTARLLASELVINSVIHGTPGPDAKIGFAVSVERNVLRVDVSDLSPTSARPRPPSEAGGYGLALVAGLASRWGAGHDEGLNVTWFELDLALPGR